MNARRELIVGGAAVAAGLALGLPVLAQPAPAGKLKVAAVYTVPFEQQWVGRIHKALLAAQARGEIAHRPILRALAGRRQGRFAADGRRPGTTTRLTGRRVPCGRR